MKKKVTIIGSGFSSLTAACYLLKAGFAVQILEKNTTVGGRARQYIHNGFTFDMGPSFYWMPDVFESFFQDFGFHVNDFYTLKKLNPAYKVYFEKGKSLEIADNLPEIVRLFESIEKGSGAQLQKFINQAEDNYNLAIKDLVYQPGESLMEIITCDTIKKLPLFFKSIKNQVNQRFAHSWLKTILEFPVLFLGATPSDTPAFYNFMNYADFGLGTWHPSGGMYSVVKALQKLAQELGAEIITNEEVTAIDIENKVVTAVHTQDKSFTCDLLLSGADYAHTESLLPKQFRQYSNGYWNKKKFAPSALMFYVGFDKKIEGVAHHTLFFDADFDAHASSIYKTGVLPNNPLFYASFPSKTDDSIVPAGKETGVFLIPLAPDSEDNEKTRQHYLNLILDRLEHTTGQEIKSSVLFSKNYGVNDFKKDYHAYKGNAYGLANTLFQTHVLRPKMKSTKVKNLYFTGHLTVPGPGVPPSIISGKVVSELIGKHC